MPRAVAVFPWVYVDEVTAIGDIRLLPYSPKELPGDQPHVAQVDLDGIMSAYADRPNLLVSKAAILELGDWCSGMDDKKMASELFRVKHLIAFTALSKRRLFEKNFGYVNYDAFDLVVQRFQNDSTGTFSFTTRRRDGGTSCMWSSDKFAFHRPLHVHHDSLIDLESDLLYALQRLGDENHVYEAIVEFNGANSDSGTIPEHVEVVMIKSAFEWLLEIGQKQWDFVNALKEFLPARECNTTGPLYERWMSRWPKASRPIDAWALEFCALRGNAAHGKERGSEGFVLPYRSHLAFASILFPLILKKVLAKKNLFELDIVATEKLRLMDAYVMHDPFDYDFVKARVHPWSELDAEAMWAKWVPSNRVK